jgi:hypothetical protein
MTDLADEYVMLFNHGLSPDAPGCETCGGSIRAVSERLDGPSVALIDIAHSDAGCLTLAHARGIRRLGNVDRLFVRHRFDPDSQPMSDRVREFFSRGVA